MGMSAVGAPSKLYYRVTYEITKILTDLVFQGNNKAVFNYVTGEGTDSKEKALFNGQESKERQRIIF